MAKNSKYRQHIVIAQFLLLMKCFSINYLFEALVTIFVFRLEFSLMKLKVHSGKCSLTRVLRCLNVENILCVLLSFLTFVSKCKMVVKLSNTHVILHDERGYVKN